MADFHKLSEKRQGSVAAGSSTGHLFIVSAPSGAGKSTLCSAVRKHFGGLAYSVSYTTRSPRPGEREGVEYHFISEADFRQGIRQGQWAEWARVHGNYYGTSSEWIARTLNTGQDILMDIDLQGARQMLAHFPQAVTIFILPPSMAELERRLRRRGTDSSDAIALRLENAREEIGQRGVCRHEVVNNNLDQAIKALVDLIAGYR